MIDDIKVWGEDQLTLLFGVFGTLEYLDRMSD